MESACAAYEHAERMPLLSRIDRGRIFLTPVGQMVEDEWLGTNQIRRNAWVDASVVMPDHFHGIVGLGAAQIGDDAESRAHAVRGSSFASAATLPTTRGPISA